MHIFFCNKGLLEECCKEENVDVTGSATVFVGKKDCKILCPKSRVRPVTARPAP